ncbi:phosphate/phosphite/phosphonate ABC transporter substrate-binding protein [Radiobacillus kanasensis]|uniref:phosphate/phosphite/phosphonate ABC transporter substrate-binding protein n=1 Tax=Radiobacillus kanasensis TaxID=2844358 RepID=UPI001E2AEFE7|nr:phosphate/phosphite/phosphonate ABC transporter substrate-binding protein [Radiobacillus kanasensis]UFT98426.1 phosphate/phosphite/phosphonate ABC transporter substrate-binding protein [Radiobacillus kanasensis]
MKNWLYLLFICSVLVILAACNTSTDNSKEEKQLTGDESDKTEAFTIGVIPSQTEGAMENAMNKLQSILSEELGRKVKVDVYPNYNGVVEAMNYDKIDMAYLGPLTYVIAHAKSGAKAIVTQLIDGEPFYHSYIITHKDNSWDNLDELFNDPKKIDFAFGDPASTSGSLIPGIELKKRGVYQSEDKYKLNSARFTGSHDATALAVQNKQVDAGAIDSAIFNQLVESGKIKGDQIKKIWQSDKLFQYPWAVHKDTDQETITKLQEAFLNIKDKEILNAFGASAFTKASNEDYKSIKKAAEKEGFIKE